MRRESSTSTPRSTSQPDRAGELDLGRRRRRRRSRGRRRSARRCASSTRSSWIAVVVRSHSTSMPCVAQRALEHPAGGGVELALHQPVGEVDDGDRDPAVGDRARGLQAEQPAADHDRAARAVRAAADRAHVVAGAERRSRARCRRSAAGTRASRWRGRARRRRAASPSASVVDAPLGVDVGDRAAEARSRAPGTSGLVCSGRSVASRWPARWSVSPTRSYGQPALVAGERDARVAVLEAASRRWRRRRGRRRRSARAWRALAACAP